MMLQVIEPPLYFRSSLRDGVLRNLFLVLFLILIFLLKPLILQHRQWYLLRCAIVTLPLGSYHLCQVRNCIVIVSIPLTQLGMESDGNMLYYIRFHIFFGTGNEYPRMQMK